MQPFGNDEPGHEHASYSPPTAAGAIPPPASTWPIVFGVIGILVALAEAAFATVWGIGMSIFLLTKERTARVRNQPAQDAVHATVELINYGLVLVLALVLFIASIQLIRRRKSGVRLASIWGLARMVLAAVYTAGAILAATFAGASRMGGVNEGEFIGGLLIVYIPLLLLTAAYPIMLLLWLGREKVGRETDLWK